MTHWIPTKEWWRIQRVNKTSKKLSISIALIVSFLHSSLCVHKMYIILKTNTTHYIAFWCVELPSKSEIAHPDSTGISTILCFCWRLKQMKSMTRWYRVFEFDCYSSEKCVIKLDSCTTMNLIDVEHTFNAYALYIAHTWLHKGDQYN